MPILMIEAVLDLRFDALTGPTLAAAAVCVAASSAVRSPGHHPAVEADGHERCDPGQHNRRGRDDCRFLRFLSHYFGALTLHFAIALFRRQTPALGNPALVRLTKVDVLSQLIVPREHVVEQPDPADQRQDDAETVPASEPHGGLLRCPFPMSDDSGFTGAGIRPVGLRPLQERDAAFERWLREEAVPAYEAAKADPSARLSAKTAFAEARARYGARRKAAVEAPKTGALAERLLPRPARRRFRILR